MAAAAQDLQWFSPAKVPTSFGSDVGEEFPNLDLVWEYEQKGFPNLDLVWYLGIEFGLSSGKNWGLS